MMGIRRGGGSGGVGKKFTRYRKSPYPVTIRAQRRLGSEKKARTGASFMSMNKDSKDYAVF